MVLATILHCAMSVTFSAPENAVDAWNEWFIQIEGVEIPQGMQSEWTEIEKEQYKQLLPLINQIKEIAKIPTCDWGLDYSKGLEMELPHLGDIRQAAQLIAFSIQGDAEIGNYASALQGMESLIGISQQATDRRSIITSLVSYSIFAIDKNATFLFDSSEDVDQLDSLQSAIALLDQFDPFGIRSSVTGEQQVVSDWLLETDLSTVDLEGNFGKDDLEVIRAAGGLDIQRDVSSYNEAMDQMVDIFAMPDEKEALGKLSELQEAVKSGDYGFLTKALFIQGDNLLKAAFEASKDVREMRTLLQQRIDMLRAPNASAYFLQAVNAYCAIDVKERIEATEKREFEIFDKTFQLLSTAAEMNAVKITLSNDPRTPPWLAPIYAMTMDGLARGTTGDFITALRVAGHLCMQERLDSSVAALMIVDSVIELIPDHISREDRTLLLEATRRIPAADAFLILATTAQETTRFQDLLAAEQGWSPAPMMLVAASLTLGEENGSADSCRDSWLAFIEAIGVPDDDTVVLAAVTQNMADVLLLAEFEHELQFIEKLRSAKNKLLLLRRKLSTEPARQ
jgi:hypothetical protein